MAKLQKLNEIWYLTDTKYAPSEGSSVLFNRIPTYASFVDELNELCIVTIDGMTKNIGFESIEVIVGSSNKNDNSLILKMSVIGDAIANLFISPTVDEKYCLEFPDKPSEIIGYYDTILEARCKLFDWFCDNKIEIVRHKEYECEYKIINNNSIEITDIKVIE